MPELSRRYGVSDYALRMFFAEEGLPPNRSSLTREQVEQIAALHQAGTSALEVSRRVGVPDSTVRLELARLRSVRP
ncbi:helix-turn-helix domain-containing protein [Serinicoccus marinus]|uniref:helix-turn-helix domain-containing protein n=1 Tax=Serinicoccus marinus TaxID=247333 RepID=UPI00249136B4|nr:helix-turn-helix domain-containing protein [Serinicoccus marinus]